MILLFIIINHKLDDIAYSLRGFWAYSGVVFLGDHKAHKKAWTTLLRF